VTFSIPQIHCSSCIWLLENLHRLHESVLSSRVDFQRRQVSIAFQIDKLPLSRLVALLGSIGYEPEISLTDLDRSKPDRSYRSLYGRLAVAGFCFGNIMLLSFPRYLGMEATSDLSVNRLFDYLKILLAIPVVFYGALEFFRPAISGLRHRQLNMDVPIALGIAVTFGYSIYEILVVHGPGYMDSLSALVFLLLVGRLYQKKTYFSLAFERGYRSYLPIAVMRKTADSEQNIPLDEIVIGDTIVLRNHEIIPADGILRTGLARIDYSFVTGESTPIRAEVGDKLYAGGRQIGPVIQVEVTKEPSRSYLLQLWEETEAAVRNQPALETLANKIGRYFTPAVLAIAAVTAAVWWMIDPSRVMLAATSVLIVACPCALALAPPFALGTAQRLMGKARFFLKDSAVVERLASATSLVFDKTGTITQSGASAPEYVGRPLTETEKAMVYSIVRQSTHPLSTLLREVFAGSRELATSGLAEQLGQGLQAEVDGHRVQVGSAEYVGAETSGSRESNVVYVSFDGVVAGCYRFANLFRPGLNEVVTELSRRLQVSLISGDHEGDRDRVRGVFGTGSELRFYQSPADKLHFVSSRVQSGERVIMVGDGLNDAGALKAATVGLTVVEDDASFTPASDGVLSARSFRRLPQLIGLARNTMTIIRISFAISLVYNLVGLGFAVQGLLSPVVAAILMPLSSVTVVLFTTLMTGYLARRRGIL
jgi:Cu+-exporting ATPase